MSGDDGGVGSPGGSGFIRGTISGLEPTDVSVVGIEDGADVPGQLGVYADDNDGSGEDSFGEVVVVVVIGVGVSEGPDSDGIGFEDEDTSREVDS